MPDESENVMRKAREALRLLMTLDLSHRQTGKLVGLSHNTAARYQRLIQEKGLDWEAVSALSDAALKAILYPGHFQPTGRRAEPDWSTVHKEMQRKGVTLLLLWHEYKESHPEDGMSYQAFTRAYRRYRQMLGLVMRQEHRAGDKVFVDYSGQRVDIHDARTGERRAAEIFVGVLGASNFTYLDATYTQALPDWISSHIRMFDYFGAAPRLLIPDNLRSAVSKACEFEPIINPTYQEMARHYNIAVVPARKYRPKDKAKAENGVQLVQRWVLARLRHRTFHSLAELNAALRDLLEQLNDKPFKRLEGSRRTRFEDIEKPAMRLLPATRFEMAEWRVGLRVGLDYHVIIDQHAYSVPYRLAREKVDARLTPSVVELLHNNRRVATHERKHQSGGHSTVLSHMPSAHRRYAGQSPERLLAWATRMGTATGEIVRHYLESRPHPEAGFRSCMGLQRLARTYGDDRLEAACHRALAIKSPSYTSIQSILKNNLDRQPLLSRSDAALPTDHGNVRGEAFYQEEES